MSTYEKKTWVNNETKVNATNMNHIEEGIYNNSVEIEELKNDKQDVLIPGANIIIEGNTISGVATNYPVLPAEEGGVSESLVTTGEKFFWNNKQDALTFDIMPTLGSNNPVTSNGIRTYIDQWLAQKANKNGFAFEPFECSILTASDCLKTDYNGSGYYGVTIDHLEVKVKQNRNDWHISWPRKNGTFALLEDIHPVPTKTSELTNDSGYLVLSDLDDFALKSWVLDQHYLVNVSWDIITGKPTFASVATSGNYNDLINKPNIPTKTSDLTNDSNFVSDASYVHTDNNFTDSYKTQIEANTAKVSNVKADWNANSGEAQILNKPNLAQVATSGSYNDLSDKITVGEGLEFVNRNEMKVDETVNRRYKISPDDVTQEDTIFYFRGNAKIAILKMDGAIELDGREFAEDFPSLGLRNDSIYQFIPSNKVIYENSILCYYQYVSLLAYMTNTLTFSASINSSTGEIGDFQLSLSDVTNVTFIPTDLKADDSNPSKLMLYNTEDPAYVGNGILTSSINGDPIIGDAPKNLNFAKNADNELEKVTWGQEEFEINAPYIVQENDIVNTEDPTHSGSTMYTAKVTFSERLGDIIKEGKRELIFPGNLANKILGTDYYGVKFKFIPLSNSGIDQDTPYDFLQSIGYSSTKMNDYLVLGKEEYTIIFSFHDHYQEEQEVPPSKLSSNVGLVTCESKVFIYNFLNMSCNVSIQNLREVYYNGMCSIDLRSNFTVYGELRMKVTIGNENTFAPDIIFSPAGMEAGYLATSIIALSGTYYNYSGGQVIDQFTFPTEIQVYARLIRKTVNGTTSVFVEVLRIDKPSYTLVLRDFLRYASSGIVAGWDVIDGSANMEFTFSSDKMRSLIATAQPIISVHFPTLNVPTTYLELIDCLNTLFDPTQGYASHASPIIPLILCQLIVGADTAKEAKIEDGSDIIVFRHDLQVDVNLSSKKMLIYLSGFASQIGGETLIEDRENDLYYTLSGHWTI